MCVGVVWLGIVRRWSWGEDRHNQAATPRKTCASTMRSGLCEKYAEMGGKRAPGQVFWGPGNKAACSVIYLSAIVYHSIGVFSGHMVAGGNRDIGGCGVFPAANVQEVVLGGPMSSERSGALGRPRNAELRVSGIGFIGRNLLRLAVDVPKPIPTIRPL